MKHKLLIVLKGICLFFIFSIPLKLFSSIFSGLLAKACWCYDSIFQRKLIKVIGYVIADLIGVFFSIKTISRKNDLSNNNLLLPVYLFTLIIIHPFLRDFSYFQVFNEDLSSVLDFQNYSYNSEFEKFIINNFEFVKNGTFIFFIAITILNFLLIIHIINKSKKRR